mgnify:CR=1 FL=1
MAVPKLTQTESLRRKRDVSKSRRRQRQRDRHMKIKFRCGSLDNQILDIGISSMNDRVCLKNNMKIVLPSTGNRRFDEVYKYRGYTPAVGDIDPMPEFEKESI